MSLPHLWNTVGPAYLPYRLLLLARLIERRSARDVQQHGLTLPEWRVLALMNRIGPTSASEIGRLGEVDRAEISRAVSKLLRRGLVERSADPTHGKRFILAPTKAGRALFEVVRQARRHSFGDMISELTEEDRIVMERSLELMARRLSEE
jgi:DNA-binding MarR family transcriptional regulator